MKRLNQLKGRIPVLLIVLFLVSGCAAGKIFEPEIVIVPADTLTPSLTRAVTETPIPTNTVIPTETNTPTPTKTATLTPSLTFTFTPTWTPTITPTATIEPSPTPWGYIPDNAIVIYLSIIGTGGPIGCGDSIIPVMIGVNKSGNVEQDIKIAVDRLFSIGPVNNSTYPSSLRAGEVTIKGGEATVQLHGNYVKPKDACEAHRYREQVWATIRQFEGITWATPMKSGAPLGDLLSAVKGDG